MKMIKFTVPGEPFGKKNMRPTRIGTHMASYSPAENKNYSAKVLMAYQQNCEGFKFGDDDQLVCTIKAYFLIPKGVTKKKLEQIQAGTLRPTKKPDCDNISKIILDSINKIAFRDDSQIVKLIVEKHYSEILRVEIVLETLEQVEKSYA